MSESTLDTRPQQAGSTEAQTRHWRRPAYEVTEEAERFHIRVQLPGVNRSGVDISIEEELLCIEGTRNQTLPETWRPLRRELPLGDYRLQLRLNVPINEAAIEAKVIDGVLDLTLPKADEVKPRKIQVS